MHNQSSKIMPGLTNYKQLNKIYNQDFTEKEFNEFETKLFNDKLNLTTYTTEIPDELDSLCKYWHMQGLITGDKYLECANKLVELNDSRGYLRLGLREVDKEQANVYFQKSFEMGNATASLNLGMYYLNKERIIPSESDDYVPTPQSDTRNEYIEQCLFYFEKAFDYEPTDTNAESIMVSLGNIFRDTLSFHHRSKQLLDKAIVQFTKTNNEKNLSSCEELKQIIDEIDKLGSELLLDEITNGESSLILKKKKFWCGLRTNAIALGIFVILSGIAVSKFAFIN